MNHNNFCNNVYLLMKRNNLTQQELALKAFVSQSEISKIINGRLNPSLKTVIKLVQAFDVSFEKLCSEKLKQVKTCHHPYGGNMCMNAKPGDKCPDCGMNGYND